MPFKEKPLKKVIKKSLFNVNFLQHKVKKKKKTLGVTEKLRNMSRYVQKDVQTKVKCVLTY